MRLLVFFLFPIFLFAEISEEKLLQRINYHLVIEDYKSAVLESREALDHFPTSKEIWISYINALSKDHQEALAIETVKNFFSEFKEEALNREVLEDLGWGILNKGSQSMQYSIRLISLVGSYLTNDVRAVSILSNLMKDSNAILRSVALQLACRYPDEPLRRQVAKLLDDEKVWLVRLEVINTVGAMRIKEKDSKLKEIIASEKSTFEEKANAIKAIINIYDKASIEEIKVLAKSPKAGLRQLSSELASHFRVKEAKEDILSLVQDPIADVRISALNAIGLFYIDFCSLKEIEQIVSLCEKDSDAAVSITASWLATVANLKTGPQKLKEWLFNDFPDNRRLAAGALAKCVNRAMPLAKEIIKDSLDPFVKANVAIGLIGQRVNVKECCDIIFDLLQNEKQLWMIDNRKNSLFEVLCPSQLRHIDQIPHYPEAIDQMTRLNLFSILAVMEDTRSYDAIKSFLKQKSWGITGVAAATLLQEGDSEALQIVRQLLKEDDKVVRVQAALVLAFLGKDETVIPILENAYFEAERDMKLYILEALGHIAEIESYPFFVKVLNEPFQALRVVDASSIVQAINR
ncbi:MAG: HEAT repeat domain-containing protein [Chlamydiae bacterium]|nr:HEAT repeat domain-containing protein [Chlamydiota bacterium]